MSSPVHRRARNSSKCFKGVCRSIIGRGVQGLSGYQFGDLGPRVTPCFEFYKKTWLSTLVPLKTEKNQASLTNFQTENELHTSQNKLTVKILPCYSSLMVYCRVDKMWEDRDQPHQVWSDNYSKDFPLFSAKIIFSVKCILMQCSKDGKVLESWTLL